MIIKLKAPTIHAIRIVKYIAVHRDESLVASDICKNVNLTSSYFMRLVKDLRRAGIMESIQGRYGGFVLCRPLEKITLYELISAMEGDEPFTEIADMEKLVSILNEVNGNISWLLKKVSLADL